MKTWCVTRTWYVEANTAMDAIQNSKRILHDCVEAMVMAADTESEE